MDRMAVVRKLAEARPPGDLAVVAIRLGARTAGVLAVLRDEGAAGPTHDAALDRLRDVAVELLEIGEELLGLPPASKRG